MRDLTPALPQRYARRRKQRAGEPRLQRLCLIELLAQSFAACTHYVSRNARRLYDASELPPALERIALGLQRGSRTWLAWIEESETRFIVAELPTHRGRTDGEEGLRLFFYDEDGRYLTMGEWEMRPGGRWALSKR